MHSRFHVNDGQVLREATLKGLGIAALPRYLVEHDIRTARLLTLLDEFPLAVFWLKVLVPSLKMSRPAVRELVTFLKASTQPHPPWATASSD